MTNDVKIIDGKKLEEFNINCWNCNKPVLPEDFGGIYGKEYYMYKCSACHSIAYKPKSYTPVLNKSYTAVLK